MRFSSVAVMNSPMHSDDIAISVRNLTKTYRLFGHPGDRIKQFFSLGLKQYHREFTALKDVSFDIKKGETVGIIGRNGSGKSTLLQLICGILKPSVGNVQVAGRISALLELGAGFNPEFTGRENVYFQGALMGFTHAQVDERFDDIAAFADIGEFIDQPVRIYSSGMFVRLAFAVAVNVDPEILVVDEALAVGDAGFRARCYRRIGELRNAGCTILLVSHDMEQVIRLCGRTILLEEGNLLLSGQPDVVVPQLQHLLRSETAINFATDEQVPNTGRAVEYEPNGALIESVKLVDAIRQPVGQLRHGLTYRFCFRVHFTQVATNVRYAVLIKTLGDIRLGGAMSAPSNDAGMTCISQGSVTDVEFTFACMLNPDTYLLNVAAFGSLAGVEYALHGIEGALTFQVVSDSDISTIGHVDLGFSATVRLTDVG